MDLFGNTHSHSLYIIGNGFDLAHGIKTSWQYDLNSIFDYCTEDIEIDEEHMMRTNFIIEDSPDSLFVPHKDELVQYFMDCKYSDLGQAT